MLKVFKLIYFFYKVVILKTKIENFVEDGRNECWLFKIW